MKLFFALKNLTSINKITQYFIHPDEKNLNSNELNEYVILGAVITIQAAWRAYKCRKEFKKKKFPRPNSTHQNSDLKMQKCSVNDNSKHIFISGNSDTFSMNLFTKSCLMNAFMCDVAVIIEDAIFYCHSLALWTNSNYFKNIFENEQKLKIDTNSNGKIKYKFRLLISKPCWIAIQNYIYGYKIEISKAILKELIDVANDLEIKNLLIDLRKNILFEGSNPKLVQSQISNKAYSNKMNARLLDSLNFDNNNIKHNKDDPNSFQILGNYYNFFKFILNSYIKKKISLEQANEYFSSKYINYETMNEKQLRKCIYLLKTKTRIQNSALLTEIINVFLKK